MHPEIIQGGMGVGVSSWQLASAVAREGQLGVVSGTALDATLVRRLWQGDPTGDLRRAIGAFPDSAFAAEILDRYFRPADAEVAPFPVLPLHRRTLTVFQQRLLVLANFVEVFLAKEGHDGAIGINYLMKIQMPTLPSLYGALLAGVDYVLMGAGIPREIPGALDALAEHEPARLRLDVVGGSGADDEVLEFDPRALWPDFAERELRRAKFLAIVSSDSLATMLARKANGRVDGFVIEAPEAGGHNAPPRRSGGQSSNGEPVYGPRDYANLEKVRQLDVPFWLAGGTGHPQRLAEAREQGAAGVQVGTLFAYTRESGLRADLRNSVIDMARGGNISVYTDGRASPTGFPFKTVRLDHTLSEERVYAERERVCDLGYLRIPYRRADGRIDYRCPSEPVDTYVKKGGESGETEGRKCLCNGLVANIGLAQIREDGVDEPPILTSGDELEALGAFLGDRESYSAADVIDYLLSPNPAVPTGA